MISRPKVGSICEVRFTVEARDEQELISRGFHKLRVIRCESFASRATAKQSRHGAA